MPSNPLQGVPNYCKLVDKKYTDESGAFIQELAIWPVLSLPVLPTLESVLKTIKNDYGNDNVYLKLFAFVGRRMFADIATTNFLQNDFSSSQVGFVVYQTNTTYPNPNSNPLLYRQDFIIDGIKYRYPPPLELYIPNGSAVDVRWLPGSINAMDFIQFKYFYYEAPAPYAAGIALEGKRGGGRVPS